MLRFAMLGLLLASSLYAGDVPRIGLPPDQMRPTQVVRMVDPNPDWSVKSLKSPEAWAKGIRGKGVRVAVLDTGVDANHPDLANRIKSPADMKDFSGSAFGIIDRVGHGTHCAGSILADGPLPGNAPEAELIAGKVLGDTGSGGVDDIANGIRWAVTRKADVISMSLGGGGTDSFIPPALIEAEDDGIIVIAAAGNSGPGEGTVGFPGGYKQCVCVGAVDVSLRIATFSSRGSTLFISGPGVNVRSTVPGGQYGTMSGTSMATPNIAGIAALWVAAHPDIPRKDRPAAFRKALIESASDLGIAGRDTAYGYGFPDATKLVGTIPPVPPIPPIPFVGFTGTLVYKNGILIDVKK